MKAPRTILAALATLGLNLALSPAAQASVTYGPIASFGAGEVSGPVGVAVDQASGSVYVGNLLGGGVRRYGPPGNHLTTFDSGLLSGTAVDPVNGNVYVVNAAEQTIETYDSSGKLISAFSIAGSGNLFGVYTVVQIASDSVGNVYLPNAPNNEVQELSPSGGVLQTITGSGASALKEPTGVALDAAGNVYVADTGNGRVEQFSPTGVFVRAITSPGAQAVAVDGAGNVYVGENSGPGFHVVVYDPSANQLSDFGMGTIGTSEFGAINTLAVGPTGRVYVTDGGNNVVRIYAQQQEPSFINVSSSAVKQTSATLNATINPNYADTTYHFEYGTSTAYGTSLPVPDADIGNGPGGPVVVGQELSGLQPGTTYHYRVIATNAIGQTIGADQTFTTPPPQPPVVSTGQASGVAQNTATLSGTIDAQGFQTTYEFDLGTDTSYGTRTFGDAGAEPGSQAFTVSLQGLAPASAYHYRIVATNIFGTSYGADEAFTTSSYSSSMLTAPAAPALVPAPPIASATASASAASVKSVARSARHGKASKASKRPTARKRKATGRTRGSGHPHSANRRGK